MSVLRSNRGSSSILVAMVLVLLVVFSVLAVTTAVSNLKLARKNAGMTGAYYSLDSEGERFLYEIRNDVKTSEDKADTAVKAISEGNLESPGLPDTITESISNTINNLEPGDERQRYLDELYPKLVAYYAQNEILQAYPGSISDPAADYGGDSSVYGDGQIVLSFNVERTFILNYEGNDRYLNITLNISDPVKGRNPEEVCSVREWRLWQKPFEYNDKIDLWEGRP